MILVLLAVVIAVPAALMKGGSIRRLTSLHFRWIPVLAAALLLDVAVELLVSDPSPALKTGVTGGTFLLALVFVMANVRLRGMALVAIGLLLNLAAILSNGAMPVSRDAARNAGSPISDLNDGLKHEVLRNHTALPWIADIFPVPALGFVFSIGDVLIAAGIGVVVFARMTRSSESAGAARGSTSD